MKKEKSKKGMEYEVAELGNDGDYTSFIMRVMNTAINVAQNSNTDKSGRTIF